MKKNTINAKTAKKLRRVLDFIDQQTAVLFDMEVGLLSVNRDANASVFRRSCGTVGCFAGFTVLQKLWSLQRGATPLRWGKVVTSGSLPPDPDADPDNSGIRWYRVSYAAGQILGLHSWQGERLFHLREWPLEFRDAYRRSRDREGRAKVLRARVEYFIEKGE